jgi:hypothetical protein
MLQFLVSSFLKRAGGFLVAHGAGDAGEITVLGVGHGFASEGGFKVGHGFDLWALLGSHKNSCD